VAVHGQRHCLVHPHLIYMSATPTPTKPDPTPKFDGITSEDVSGTASHLALDLVIQHDSVFYAELVSIRSTNVRSGKNLSQDLVFEPPLPVSRLPSSTHSPRGPNYYTPLLDGILSFITERYWLIPNGSVGRRLKRCKSG
jgi:hypothetical protein